MLIRSAEYVRSSTSVDKCPRPFFPEYAFIGRSNVGKSSLINMLLNRKSLSKVSSKPGKTKTINHFLINKSWYLVDLPGYGYANVSKDEREQLDKMIIDYITQRKTLSCVFLLIDSRIKLQEIDKNFMLFLGKNYIPFVIVSTKVDKVSLKQISNHKKELYDFINMYWETIPLHVLTSSVEKKGREEILNIIEKANIEFKQNVK